MESSFIEKNKKEELLSKIKFENLFEELKKTNDLESRVKITLKALESILPFELKCESKDSEQSINLRKKADKEFVRRKGRIHEYLKVLELYSKSLAKAEKSSTALARAYANRSALYFNFFLYRECVNDINRALELSYPDELRPNLVRRKAKCLKILGEVDAENVCEEARCLLENLSLSDEKKEELEIKIDKASKVQTLNKSNLKINEKLILPEIIPHKNIPSASNAIDINYNKDLGKHLIASRNINAGEILVIERPYASVLNPKNFYTHCSHCLRRLLYSIPCDYCVYAMYCSEKCRNEAWEKYHDIECPVTGYFLGLNMNSMTLLSLKLIVLAVREYGNIKKLKTVLEEVDSCEDNLMKSFLKCGTYCSSTYRSFYNLSTLEENRKGYEILTIALNAALTLYYVFTFTSFFDDNSAKNISNLYNNKDALFIGKLIARHYMIIQLNDNMVSELFSDEIITIGSSIGVVTSLLNHSCNPNVSKLTVLKNNVIQQIIYALHPIEKNSQILESYCGTFLSSSKSERNETLKLYHLKCNCEACNKIWPLLEDLPSILAIITDKEKKVEVSRAIIRSKDCERTIYEVGLDNYNGDKGNILATLAKSITKIYESTKIPTKEYYEMLILFQKAFHYLYGNQFIL